MANIYWTLGWGMMLMLKRHALSLKYRQTDRQTDTHTHTIPQCWPGDLWGFTVPASLELATKPCLFTGALGIKLGPSSLQGKHLTDCIISPALFNLGYSLIYKQGLLA